jgi:tRNA (guanine37-N1)-methyltransferase|tara:strand:+ start:676 stop:1671 length:996 start_codon:yes stop_codon:yes gene_type:complete
LIKHLKVVETQAQKAKVFLEDCNALNGNFLPIKRDGFVLWPLNFEVEGDVVECEGLSSTRISRDYRLKLPLELRNIAPRAFDIFGSMAIIKINDEVMKHSDIISKTLLDSNPNIDRVALDMGVKGEFRIRELVMIQGKSNFIAIHKENGLKIKLDVSKVYFSPRLAMERKRIVDAAVEGEHILDAFAGASPFSVGLAKKGCKLTSVDSNPEAEKWSHENFELNGIRNESYRFITSKIEDIIQDLDIYDRIIMNNPTNPLPYLEGLSSLLKQNGFIHLYKIVEKDAEFKIENHLKSDFKCVSKRVVHPYSPQSSMMAFDITRAVSNVRNTNQ